MSNHKITMVLSSFNGGGAERMMVQLANGFVKKGIHVDLIVLRNQGEYKKDVYEKVNTIICPNLPSVYMYIFVLFIIFITNRPQKILSTQTHVNNVTMFAAIPLFLRKKVVFREANTPSQSYNEIKNIQKKVTSFLSKITYRLTEKIIAVSNGVKFDVATFYDVKKTKIKVIYNSVEVDNIINKSNQQINHALFVKNEIKIISIGNLSYKKGYDHLINAFEQVRRDRICKLYIIGKNESDYGKEIKKMIVDKGLEESIILLGFVENPYKYMSNANLFVLASRWEGFPNVLIEALVCGCPIVSTDCPSGPNEILENGTYGRLVPVGDVDLMSQAIIDSLDSSVDREKLKNRGYEFTQERSVSEYLNYIFE